MPEIPEKWRWFPESRYGLFIHFGPYAALGRGEQVLMREMRDQRDYADQACRWNPASLDVKTWARIAADGGFKYAVLTTRHHDGYCLWDSSLTDYSSARQAPGRDFVREFVDAFRDAGLRIGLYYSWADFRVPAMFDGPEPDPSAWASFLSYCHGQIEELLTRYGRIDIMWFDGAWPHTADVWRSEEAIAAIRRMQPEILINNRLGVGMSKAAQAVDGGMGAGEMKILGDFGTPEQRIAPDPNRLWESCQVSTWRLWGYSAGERWRSADYLLDMLCQCAELGGNLLLNVGPEASGKLPEPFVKCSNWIGRWLNTNGEAIFGTTGEANAHLEPILFGRVTRRDNTLYLIVRFLPPDGVLHVPGLATTIRSAKRLDNGQALPVSAYPYGQVIRDLPKETEDDTFLVVRCDLEGPPTSLPWYAPGQWTPDAGRYRTWAAARGESVWTDGNIRPR